MAQALAKNLKEISEPKSKQLARTPEPSLPEKEETDLRAKKHRVEKVCQSKSIEYI